MKIINLFTGEKVKCRISKATSLDIRSCRENFSFDWSQELRQFQVFKLFTEENPGIVQALLSLQKDEGYLFLSKIERANFRKVKVYEGITEVIVAFCCKMSFELGFEGYITFFAKSSLLAYYRNKLGAIRVGNSQRMYISSETAKKLVDLFYE